MEDITTGALTTGLVTTSYYPPTTLYLTTGVFVPCAQKCLEVCGEGNIKNCVCKEGSFESAECNDEKSSSSTQIATSIVITSLLIISLN